MMYHRSTRTRDRLTRSAITLLAVAAFVLIGADDNGSCSSSGDSPENDVSNDTGHSNDTPGPSPSYNCWDGEVADYQLPPEEDDRPWILVDLLHTDIQTPTDHCLHRDQYSYQGAYGFYRLFEHFENYGYPWAPTELELSTPRLEPYDILFINLLHDRNPDFTEDEVEAIKDFVHDGGGLFVIGDHTNVYRHAERINRFLVPMGLEMMFHTAVDYPPVYSVSGQGWIMMFDFADHPINEGVDMISFKTGGPIDSDDPDDDLVFTSEDSFADYWDESNDHGYYGSWSQGDDEELEPSGPLSVAAATEYGDGRVALVGDQNIFGDGWVNLGHNFEFAANIVEWLAGNEDTEEPLRDQPRRGHNIAFEADVNYYQSARNSHSAGYYTMFIETNRNEAVTGRVTPELETHNTDTLVLHSSDIHFGNPDLDDRYYTDDNLNEIAGFLDDGGQVVISFQASDIPEPTIQLLETLADGFELEIDGETWSPGGEDGPASPEAVQGFHPITSSVFNVDGFHLGTLGPGEFPPHSSEERDKVREHLADVRDEPVEDVRVSNDDIYRQIAEEYEPEEFLEGGDRDETNAFLYDVDVHWGDPLIEAELPDGTTAIAHRKLVGDGELIIFVQDGFWRNWTMGSNELLRPTAFFRQDIVASYHRFLDYLRGQ